MWSKYKKHLIALIFSLVFITIVGTIYIQKNNRESAIHAISEWARLSSFPNEVKELKISTEGSAFTRAFRVSFNAEKTIIEKWLAKCPGIKDAKIDSEENVTKYIIKPGGGAQYAEVKIYWKNNIVEIYTFWS